MWWKSKTFPLINHSSIILLIFVLALVAVACGGAEATPCDEVEITTGENGLPDLDGCEFTFAVENAYYHLIISMQLMA